jgi:HEAT repeat protein
MPPLAGYHYPYMRDTAIPARTDWDDRWAKLLLPRLDPKCSAVAVALGLVMGSRAVPELLRVLEASTENREIGVIETLGRLRAREAIPPLLKVLTHWSKTDGLPPIWILCQALQRIADPSIIPDLETIAGDATNRQVTSYLDPLIGQLKLLQSSGK